MSIHGKYNKKSVLLILFDFHVKKVDYYGYYFIAFLWLLSSTSLTISKELIFNEGNNYYLSRYKNTGNYLRGPENQTVLFNTNTIMHCRFYDRDYNMTKLRMFYQEYLNVQWIIDGFGVNNESLKAVRGERYSMPGPIEEGKI
ncbi:unnamed protein product [Schistosoma turkestanicum]|nr:unnamed protein product [Schistosoma turkestanicum]